MPVLKKSPIADELRKIENALFLLADADEEVKQEQIECIREAMVDIDYALCNMRDEKKELQEKVDELEREDDEEYENPFTQSMTVMELRDSQQFNGSMAIYADNLRDQGILEGFAASLYHQYHA